jgi:hypothetical protein
MGARTHYFKSARRAPIILGVLDEHQFSRRARALTTQRGTSTHCSKANKQRAIAKWTWKNKFMKCSLEKMGARAPIILGARRAPIILGGLDEHRFLRGREHSSFREHSIRELMNEHIWIWKESQKNKLMKYSLEKWGRAPIILWGHAHSLFWGLDEHRFLRGLDEHSFLRGLDEHSLFQGGTPALNNVALFRL